MISKELQYELTIKEKVSNKIKEEYKEKEKQF